MSRAAFLPTPGDPFLLNYWLKWWPVWRDEVDKLYIHYNSPGEEAIVEYIRDLIKDDNKITLFVDDHNLQHGDSLKQMLLHTSEDLVMFVEDDAIIFKPGMVDQQFKLIENNVVDAVVSLRGSCSQQIIDKAIEKWGTTSVGMSDGGPNFWPNFFFAKRSDLMKTDLDFKAKTWHKGDYIPQLDLKVEDELVGDTFVWGSIQLRGLNLRFGVVNQYHAAPEDLDHYNQNVRLFDGQCPWFHIGSLSSGFNGVLMDNYSRPLAQRKLLPEGETPTVLHNYANTEQEKQEWERRVQWWLTFVEQAPSRNLQELHSEYKQAIFRIIDQYKLSLNRIRKRQLIYERLMGVS